MANVNFTKGNGSRIGFESLKPGLSRKGWRQKKVLLVVLIVVAVLAVGTVGMLAYKSFYGKQARQAVFLTNGQVYFGYLSNPNGPIVSLADTYYLKSAEALQGGDNSKVVLVKLGGELHGPEGTMQINRDQILFYENMRSNSKVNSAIDKAKSATATVTPDKANSATVTSTSKK